MIEPSLFPDPKLLSALARLHIVARRRADGAPAGDRSGRRRGVSLDFADHRGYVAGDDLRFLDWKVLARHDQPWLRRYHEEQALPVRILLDVSASMGFGAPSKLDLARGVAAGIAFVALHRGAALSVHPFAGLPLAPLGPLRGRRAYHAVLETLSRVVGGGSSDLDAAVRAAAPTGRAGLTVVLSDFLCPGGFEAALGRLDHARHSSFLVRLVAAEEEVPRLGGEVTLVDSESGEERAFSLTPSLLAAYRDAHIAFDRRLEEAAARRGAGVARLAGEDLATALLSTLPRRGLFS